MQTQTAELINLICERTPETVSYDVIYERPFVLSIRHFWNCLGTVCKLWCRLWESPENENCGIIYEGAFMCEMWPNLWKRPHRLIVTSFMKEPSWVYCDVIYERGFGNEKSSKDNTLCFNIEKKIPSTFSNTVNLRYILQSSSEISILIKIKKTSKYWLSKLRTCPSDGN